MPSGLDDESFEDDLLAFLSASPTPFHAVANLRAALDAAGYRHLPEDADWTVAPGDRCYVIRNQGSIVAFRTGAGLASGLRMVGAHTDSPCLKVKPDPQLPGDGYLRLGVEVYGGVLLNPWFDRDLSLAGRVHYRTSDGRVAHALIDFPQALAIIPSLAIHLDREANQNRSINAQRDIPPLIATLSASADGADAGSTFTDMLVAQIRHQHPDADVAAILDHELCFHDTQAAARVGLRGEFIASARLDNLLSCFCGLRALLASDDDVPALLVCNDHEEVGSNSTSGAAGPLLRSVLERLTGSADAFAQLIARSMLVSADNAHAVHPNFADRHDGNHGPKLGGGPVIKVNANQRYASNSATQALFRDLCAQAEVPVQMFVTRTDLACGSTIGPITATELGVRTIDVGIPQLAMHSIREVCHAQDPRRMARALAGFQSLRELPPLD
ncbi:MAG TPA: M18 family aminopeptidase [Pseudomonadales bacterium]|nr:M18 family aminopeptidase [Pseudomonadales bacterium]